MRWQLLALFCASIALIVAPAGASAEPFLLGPPDGDGPVTVSVGFFLGDVNEVDERREAFEFEAFEYFADGSAGRVEFLCQAAAGEGAARLGSLGEELAADLAVECFFARHGRSET